MRRVARIFLQSNPEDLDLNELDSELRLMNNVEDEHDVHACSLDGKYNVLSLHEVISQISNHETLVQLKTKFASRHGKWELIMPLLKLNLLQKHVS